MPGLNCLEDTMSGFTGCGGIISFPAPEPSAPGNYSSGRSSSPGQAGSSLSEWFERKELAKKSLPAIVSPLSLKMPIQPKEGGFHVSIL